MIRPDRLRADLIRKLMRKKYSVTLLQVNIFYSIRKGAGMIKKNTVLYGKNIVEAREAMGWTQEVLAKKVGSSQGVIQGYECDRRGKRPDIALLLRISRALGVTMDWLLTGDEKKD